MRPNDPPFTRSLKLYRTPKDGSEVVIHPGDLEVRREAVPGRWGGDIEYEYFPLDFG